ncbi:hypothetical protein F4680DRAFT_441138 [Xylaria scruposa]|nr:hypothetical protein F4680DRAFT_441138 [Xylaria scruposa]
MVALQISPIAQLAPEILLEIFNLLALINKKGNAPLVSSILCCQKWRSLASSVLYRHVVLDSDRLEMFINNHTSCEVTSLTVKIGPIAIYSSNPYAALHEADDRTASLKKLCSLIGDIKPTTLSLSINLPFPCTAMPEVASIVDSLPESCTGLEINMKHGNEISAPSLLQAHPPHLCDSIRAVLPQLKHLRLRLPVLCSAIFSTNPSSQDIRRQAIHTPLLKTCLINLSLCGPGPINDGAWAIECGDDYARTPHVGQIEQLQSALPPMKEVLRDFAHRNRSNLERLWILDVKPAYKDHAAWIRRDFMLNVSYPIPFWKMDYFNPCDCVARVPLPTNLEETEDWVSRADRVETVAEGGTWVETETSARLPTRDMRKYQPPHWVLSGSEYRKRRQRTCTVWRNEEMTGKMTLPRGPGELMQQWDLHEITPL